MLKPIIIGIAGGSASGKTSVSEYIIEKLSDRSVQLIRHDDYYNDQSDMSMEERYEVNYDHPLAFDNNLLVKHLKMLQNGQAIEKPIYDFKEHTRSSTCENILPTQVIILEGLLILEDKRIRNFLDMKVFIDTDADVRILRRIKRDIEERNRSLDSVISQYMNSVRPMHIQFIEPSRRYADVIIPNGKSNSVGIDLLLTKIKSVLSKPNSV